MASVILAGTTSTTALNLTGDTSGELQLKTNNGSTTAMTLTTAGNVGVGTTSPSATLHVVSGSAPLLVNRTGAGNALIYLANDGSAGGVIGTDGSGDTIFFNANAAAERMRIDSSGNVGIGTSSPAQKLQIGLSGSNNYIQFGTTNEGYVIGRENVTGDFLFNATQASPYNVFKWQQGGTERMRIDSSGNVGIGVTSPRPIGGGYRGMEIGGSSGASIYLTTTSDTYRGYLAVDSGGTNLTSVTAHPLVFGTSNTERMRIASGGEVLVGTTSSSYYKSNFVVNSASSTGISIIDTSTTLAMIAFGYTTGTTIGGGSNRGKFWYDLTNDSFNWNTAGAGSLTPNMRINSAGQLLVGATSWAGGATIGLQINATNNISGAYAQLIRNSSGTEIFQMRCDGGLGNFSANNANLSDERVKTDIKLAGSYLDKICAIPVKTFKYKNQTDDLLNLGVIAQDVEAVAPELVDVAGFGETPDDGIPLKAIYQTDLQYALMKCIQEQQAIITDLKQRIETLEAK